MKSAGFRNTAEPLSKVAATGPRRTDRAPLLALNLGLADLDARAGTPLQVTAAGGVVVAYIVRVGLLVGVEGWDLRDLRLDAAGLIAVAIGAFFAASRMR